MQHANHLKQTLTRRYVVALAIIACMMVASYTVLTRHIETNDKGAYIINISGMQRMLSQRIGLMARELYNAPNDQEAQIYLGKMREAYESMHSNHEILTSGTKDGAYVYTLSPAIEDAYFSDMDMDARVQSYLEDTKNYIALYADNTSTNADKLTAMNSIVSIARNGFLDDLNAIVSLHEQREADQLEEFIQIETLILFLGLFALVLEGLFIFRPMAKSVTRSFNELETSNRELTEFSYRISHDLRAPIVSSMGLSDVCKNAIEKGQTDTALTSINFIKTSMNKLNVLIDDIINLNKIKVVEVKPEQVILSELVDSIITHASKMDNFDKIEIKQVMNISRPVFVKRLYLKQSLENLITNAVKYADLSKPKSHIEISVTESKGQCTIHVIDNGLGIPESNRDDIFQMFKRFHPKTSFGSGLGLYLVSENAKALGGSVRYEPLAHGSEFTLKFPI
jgi:signal transduction histidine kinase